MAKRVIWTATALADVEAIAAYIHRDSPAYASTFVELVITRARSLGHWPQRGRVVPEFRDPAIRETIVQSYRMVYRTKAAAVQVLALIHCRRDMARLRPTLFRLVRRKRTEDTK